LAEKLEKERKDRHEEMIKKLADQQKSAWKQNLIKEEEIKKQREE
jgi:hypothetical protein